MRRRCSVALLVGFCAALLGAGTGCESARERHIRRMMWYRPGPPAAAERNTISVGRTGTVAEYGTWIETARTYAGSSPLNDVTIGRIPATGLTGVYGATSVVGRPAGGSAAIGSYDSRAGATLGVAGGTLTTGEGGIDRLRIGTIP